MKKTTKKLKNITLIAGIAFITALSTGCSSLPTANGGSSFAFGKLYTMQEALTHASINCNDEVTRNRAISWATNGFQDLNQSSAYMDQGSDEYVNTRVLMNHLGTVSRRTKDVGTICENIKTATTATGQYMVAMGINSTVVASR